MKKWTAVTSVILIALGNPASAQSQKVDTENLMSQAFGLVNQVNGSRVITVLKSQPTAAFSADDAEVRECMLDKLNLKIPILIPDRLKDAKARQIMSSYRLYWRSSMLNSGKISKYEKTLVLSLASVVGRPDLKTMETIEPIVIAKLKGEGLYAQAGQTGPLRELMLWTKQDDVIYDVALPEGLYRPTVRKMDDFISLGWNSYHTCGRSGTGGWAEDDILHLVVPNYSSLEDEDFKVNFLAHETQHFSDIKRFVGLEDWHLEYRAKLVELATANSTRVDILRRFSNDQGDDKNSPHSFANKKLLNALRLQLGLSSASGLSAVPVATLQKAALTELLADSKGLEMTRLK